MLQCKVSSNILSTEYNTATLSPLPCDDDGGSKHNIQLSCGYNSLRATYLVSSENALMVSLWRKQYKGYHSDIYVTKELISVLLTLSHQPSIIDFKKF
jgi:hypothetical protein